MSKYCCYLCLVRPFHWDRATATPLPLWYTCYASRDLWIEINNLDAEFIELVVGKYDTASSDLVFVRLGCIGCIYPSEYPRVVEPILAEDYCRLLRWLRGIDILHERGSNDEDDKIGEFGNVMRSFTEQQFECE